jgi:tRNA(Ile2)-agmatinylcytidine synthase
VSRFSTFHIGFDDTDSAEGMCTTFLCYNLVLELAQDRNSRFVDYPNLIRLNPNIPWKTRGNAALVIRIETSKSRKKLFATCRSLLRKYSTSPKANSGLVLFEDDIPNEIKEFSRRALFSVLSVKEARSLIDRYDGDSFGLRAKQGLVGALAAIGNTLEHDHTYELIAYRKNTSVPRRLDKTKIISMNRHTFPRTFSSYDESSGRIMIAPHGPDPVLCGIRGESASDVLKAFRMLGPVENLRGWMVFRSNQGTGEHLRERIDPAEFKSYFSGRLRGMVSSKPRMEKGGHVFFTLKNDNHEVHCACYEPTRDFRKYAMKLFPGDEVEVAGGVRKSTSKHSKVLNLEYFTPLKLATRIDYSNPLCPKCQSRMKSMGSGQGFECPVCDYRSKDLQKIVTEVPRELELKTYLPPISAHRHLTKPIQRYSLREKRANSRLIKNWVVAL